MKKILLVIIIAFALVSCSKNSIPEKYIVKDGSLPRDINYEVDALESIAYRGTLDLLEKEFLKYRDINIYNNFLIAKVKKLSSTSYYKDYGIKTQHEFVDVKVRAYVGYTLSDIEILEVYDNFDSEITYDVGDKIQIIEHYYFVPSEEGKNEFRMSIGYHAPIMENNKEYLVYLRTTKDEKIEYGMNQTEIVDNVWATFEVFLLDDKTLNVKSNDVLKNKEEIYYGLFPELYKPVFEKYLNIKINEEQKATSSPTELPKITPRPEITPAP